MAAFVYILQNEQTGKYYIGSTENLERRMSEHQRGNVYTTKLWPSKRMVLAQEYQDIKTAESIEIRLKAFKSRVIINKIVKEGKIRIA